MSPKNKGTFGKGKTAVEQDDEFISTMSRVGKALEPHVKKIVYGVVAVMVLASAFLVYRWLDERKEKHATEIYARALTLANVAVLPSSAPAPAPAPDAAAGDTGPASFVPEDSNDDTIPDSYPSQAERANAVLALLDELNSEYGSTDVAASARLLHATMLYDRGQYLAAHDMYKKFLSSNPAWRLKVLAREGMGHASEAHAVSITDANQRAAALQEALASYRAIQPTAKEPEWDRALYHSARVLAALGQTEEAKKTLQQALDDVPEGSLVNDIKARQAMLLHPRK